MRSDAGGTPPDNETAASNESWLRVRSVFEAAVELDGPERKLFLDRECGEWGELRDDVEALLADYEETSGFLETPLASIQDMLADEAKPDEKQIGSRVGAYRLEQEIGRGGMGTVYLATRADCEFDRRVAIKLIRDGAESEPAVRRFRYERQILARLENAYIARLIDGGSTAAGLPYFVMEYVEGRTILEYCEANALTIRDRLHLFLKICSAVQYAHERNIIHRDLKPGNIMVKHDGTPKLLDFGIAKILGADATGGEQDATMQGSRILTPAYASPEQMRGDPATVRSDIYSLGMILYELLCGRRPAPAEVYRNAAGLKPAQDTHLSPQLRAVVLRPMHPDPLERYPTVEAFSADIRRYLGGSPPLAIWPEGLQTTEQEAAISLAILPFRIAGDQDGEKAFLASGITEVLITKLSRIDRLSLSPASAVRKYTVGVEAVRAARELQVRYVLEGSLHVSGENVRAHVQLIFAEAGIAVWAAQIDTSEKDLLAMEDAIAEQVASAVAPQLCSEERLEIGKSGTSSGPAHAAYLRGRWLWNTNAGEQTKLAQALVCFMEAIAIDPQFARAYAGVADYYLRLGLWGGLPPAESFAAAIEYAARAVELEPTLGEAHASLAFATWAYHRDEETAEKHFTLATVRNPSYASAHHWFGLLNSARNRPEVAIANLERAQRVDPNSAVIAAALGFVYYNARNYQTALGILLSAARELPKSPIIHEMLSRCYLQTGAVAEALEQGRRAVESSGRGLSAALSALTAAEAAAGNAGAASELRDEIERLAKQQYVSGYDRAAAHLANGQTQQAFQFLEQALVDRDWWLCWLAVDPRWDPLRQEPRFQKLLPRSAAGPPAKRRSRTAAALALVIAATFAAVGMWWWLRSPPTIPFSNVRFTKLTSNGTADSAVVSPDGKTVVYSALENGGTTLWRRSLATGELVKLAPRLSGKVSDLGFTSNGAEVGFVTSPLKDPGARELYRVRLSGEAPLRIQGSYPGPVSLSQDGSRAAFYISNPEQSADELWLSDLRTGKRRLAFSLKYPQRFAWSCRPAWSPDGKLIAYAAEDRDRTGFLVRLYAADAETGVRHMLASPRWQWVQGVSWTGERSALAVVGQEHESSFQQIWYIPYPGAADKVRRIGNDLDDYFGASLPAHGSEMVAVQSQTLSNIYMAKFGEILRPVQITAGSGRYFDLCWMRDGRILYASDATGSADLWTMRPDGSGQHTIVSGPSRNYAPTASPDAKSIAFHSNRSGNWQVWRAEADGSHVSQLSPSQGDGNWPQFTLDGKSVIFHKTGAKGFVNLWRVPVSGGAAVEITRSLTMHPSVSPVDGKIAAWYSERIDVPQWKIAIFKAEGGEPVRLFNPTADVRPDTALRWTPKGDGISFLDYAGSASNIWVQPVDGGNPHRLTAFDSGEVYSFDWSRDGTLIYSRGLTTSDVVLIRDTSAGMPSQ